jgi:hypothetical protein
MSKATIKWIKSICPELSQVEAELAAQRLDTFNQFFIDVEKWRLSQPPEKRVTPKYMETDLEPYLITEPEK